MNCASPNCPVEHKSFAEAQACNYGAYAGLTNQPRWPPSEAAAMEVQKRLLDKHTEGAAPVVCSVCRQAADHPEFRGTIWARKDGAGTPMSWSATLIQIAGGLYRLFTEWEPEK